MKKYVKLETVGTVERERESYSSIKDNKSMKNALFVIYARDG